MWLLSKPINLIRYLIVWRVNSSLVRLPKDFSADLSRALGTIIADRLPTQEAAPWHKTLKLWDDYAVSRRGQKQSGRRRRRSNPEQLSPIPDAPWPIETALLPYTMKQTNGKGEPILWELKLFGDSAEHDLFLEVILPAMEAAGTSRRLNRDRPHSVWGHFDIEAVYVARGLHWEPFIQAGQLDLSYRPGPVQWAEGVTFGREISKPVSTIIWLTPFEFEDRQVQAAKPSRSRRRRRRKNTQQPLPTLHDIIKALIRRISQLLPGKYTTAEDVWDMLNPEERAVLQTDLEQAYLSPIKHRTLKSAPKSWTEHSIGSQRFASIPSQLLPYLELASILHVGKHTHFGYGTFAIR